MILKGSRYSRVATYTVTDYKGNTQTAFKMRLIPPTPAFFRRTIQKSDRLDLLAFEYYGKADRFWRICDANNAIQPEELLEPGKQVFIPPDLA